MNNNTHHFFPLRFRKIRKLLGEKMFQLCDPASDRFDMQCATDYLLHHVAYANPQIVEAVLKLNPRLLLVETCDVKAPSGDTIVGVSAYECALGAGDSDLAKLIAKFYDKIENGETYRKEHLQSYISNSYRNESLPKYDLKKLVQLIASSSEDDLDKELKHQPSDSNLHDELEIFRKFFSPRVINGGSQYDYSYLDTAFKVLQRWAEYYGDAQIKQRTFMIQLLWRQVAGYLMRGLPACDRQAFAQGLSDLKHGHIPSERSFIYNDYRKESFPITAVMENSTEKLGFDYAFSVGGYKSQHYREEVCVYAEVDSDGGYCAGYSTEPKVYENYLYQKNRAMPKLDDVQKRHGCCV